MPLSNSLKYDHPGFRPGKYYQHSPFIGSYTTSSSLFSNSAITYTPLFIPLNVKADRLAVYSSNGSSNSIVRLAIYSNQLGLPSNLILDIGEITTVGTGFKEKAINLKLSCGWYWLAGTSPNSSATVYCFNSSNLAHFLGMDVPLLATSGGGYRNNFAYQPFPATAPVNNIFSIGTSPVFWYRAGQ